MVRLMRLSCFALCLVFASVACGDSTDPLTDTGAAGDSGNFGDAATQLDGSSDAGLDAGLDSAVMDSGPGDDGIVDGGDAGSPGDTGTIDGGSPSDVGSPDGGGGGTVTIGGTRPAQLFVPAGYDGSPSTVVVLLHGYTVDGATQDFYFGFSQRVDTRGFFLILPDGTREASAQMSRFWNATSACCNFYGSTVDDVAYITGLIDETAALYNIDPKRVHLVGHSNGGFMAHRMACDRPGRIASIASLAGVTHFDEMLCDGASPLSVLQIHGTNDGTIMYPGVAAGFMQYPGAEETVQRWATRAGCDVQQSQMGTPLDLVSDLPGAETEVTNYRTGCAAGIDVDLWRIVNGPHIPNLRPNFGDLVLDWLDAHPQP